MYRLRLRISQKQGSPHPPPGSERGAAAPTEPPHPCAHRGCGFSPERPPGAPATPARSRSQAPRRGVPRGRAAAPGRERAPPFPTAAPRGQPRTPTAPAPPRLSRGRGAAGGQSRAPRRPTPSARSLPRSGAPQPRAKETPCRREESWCLSPGHGYGRGISAGRRRQLPSQAPRQRVARSGGAPAHRQHAPPGSRAPAGTVLPPGSAAWQHTRVDARTHPAASTEQPLGERPVASRSRRGRATSPPPRLRRPGPPREAKFGRPRRRSRLPSKLTERGHRLNFQQRPGSAPPTASPIASRCGARAPLPGGCGAGEYKSTLPAPGGSPAARPGPSAPLRGRRRFLLPRLDPQLTAAARQAVRSQGARGSGAGLGVAPPPLRLLPPLLSGGCSISGAARSQAPSLLMSMPGRSAQARYRPPRLKSPRTDRRGGL
ncbi:translation initiation factor IF-2-like [Harpia harpyja]|uniref:translation initiation factor IF-2-like n=1 Tax=Harpia harpyja TaxID=202280 RepID=UPI0022B184E1|nr:translation initiation factor IF-2-like [Harpia harpyja]